MTIASLLGTSSKPKPECLFIGPMKGEDTPTRDRFDAVFQSIVNAGALSVGMNASRALAEAPGLITPNIFKRIRHSHVVVADVTGENTNVGYELAFAHLMARPTILLVQGGGKIPYDIEDMNTIRYELTDSGIREATEGLVAHFRKCAQSNWLSVDNPVFHIAFAPPEASLETPFAGLAGAMLAGREGTSAFNPSGQLQSEMYRGLLSGQGEKPTSVGALMSRLGDIDKK
jgi:hypothetical protein